MAGGRHDACRAGGLDVVDGDAVDDNVGYVLEREAGAAGDADVDAAAVDGLVGRNHELVLEVDRHGVGECDPQRAGAGDGVAERAGSGVGWVVVAGGRDDVNPAGLATDGVAAEPHRAVREALPVGRPVGIAAPAVVHWVPGQAAVA